MHFPVLPFDTLTCMKCRTHAKRVQTLRLEFYVDEVDGVSTLHTTSIKAFTRLAVAQQTPLNLCATLRRLGLCPPDVGLWVRRGASDDVYVALQPSMSHAQLLAGCRDDGTIVVKASGSIPTYFCEQMHDAAHKDMRRENKMRGVLLYDAEAQERRHADIEHMVAFNNNMFDTAKWRRVFAGVSPRRWALTLTDPVVHGFKENDFSLKLTNGASVIIRRDFRDGVVNVPCDVVVLDDSDT